MLCKTSDLAPAAFSAEYVSRQQRSFRLIALILLCLRHGLRGVVLAWPLYFTALIPLLIPVQAGWWIILFVFPAALVSLSVLISGVRLDYSNTICGQLLNGNGLLKILWWQEG